jgi:hypothetical protein
LSNEPATLALVQERLRGGLAAPASAPASMRALGGAIFQPLEPWEQMQLDRLNRQMEAAQSSGQHQQTAALRRNTSRKSAGVPGNPNPDHPYYKEWAELEFENPNAKLHKKPRDRTVWPPHDDIDALLAHVERELRWLSVWTLSAKKDTDGTTLWFPLTQRWEDPNSSPALTESSSRLLTACRKRLNRVTNQSSRSSTNESKRKVTG